MHWREAAQILGLSRSGYFRLINLYKTRLGVQDGTLTITRDDLPVLERAVALVRSGRVRSYEEAFTYLRLERLETLADLKAQVQDLSVRLERLDGKGVQSILALLGVILQELDALRQDLHQVRLVLHATLYPMAQQDADVSPHLKPVPLPISKEVLKAETQGQASTPGSQKPSEGKARQVDTETPQTSKSQDAPKQKKPWYME